MLLKTHIVLFVVRDIEQRAVLPVFETAGHPLLRRLLFLLFSDFFFNGSVEERGRYGIVLL